jgi:hypothetical protein
MEENTLPHFGKIPTDNLEEYYVVDIDFKGNQIQVDLNFESETLDTSTFEKIKKLIENIEKFDEQNKKYILEDYNDDEGDTVKFYLEHHLDEVGKEELSTLINFDDTTSEPEKQLLDKLKMVRVGLYPHDKENFAIFDYSIGTEITNYLVVINTDENGELDYMAMES